MDGAVIELIASIVLLYAVVGGAAIWYRRAKARLAEQDEQDVMRFMPGKG